MSWIDKELQRTIKYAEGLGLKVVFKRYRKGDPGAAWLIGANTIELYTWPKQSKTRIIINLLHELGHHLDYIHSNKTHKKMLLKAIDLEDNRTKSTDPLVPKKYRKYIYNDECMAAYYMPIIAKELDLKIPMWKVECDAELDKWVAYVYYKTGNYPLSKDLEEKRKELRIKHNS